MCYIKQSINMQNSYYNDIFNKFLLFNDKIYYYKFLSHGSHCIVSDSHDKKSAAQDFTLSFHDMRRQVI